MPWGWSLPLPPPSATFAPPVAHDHPGRRDRPGLTGQSGRGGIQPTLDRTFAPDRTGREPLLRGGAIRHPQPMSISAAITEIQSATLSARQLRYRQFRAHQHALDELIDEVESVIGEGARTLPDALRRRAELTLAKVH